MFIFIVSIIRMFTLLNFQRKTSVLQPLSEPLSETSNVKPTFFNHYQRLLLLYRDNLF